MARPKVREGEVATSARLLETAEAEFATHGYHGAKLADIAEAAGISRPSLLYHYGSKHALYAAVVRHVLHDIGVAVGGAVAAEGRFEARLQSVIRTVSDFLGRRPSAARILIREVMDDRGPGHHLILEFGVPVLDSIEDFVRTEGRGIVPNGVPVRHALLAVLSDVFLRRSTGALEHALWGDQDHSAEIAHALLLGCVDSEGDS